MPLLSGEFVPPPTAEVKDLAVEAFGPGVHVSRIQRSDRHTAPVAYLARQDQIDVIVHVAPSKYFDEPVKPVMSEYVGLQTIRVEGDLVVSLRPRYKKLLAATIERKRRGNWLAEYTARMEIVHDVLRGLVAIHEAGAVHGDVTEENVAVSGAGNAQIIDQFLLGKVEMDEPASSARDIKQFATLSQRLLVDYSWSSDVDLAEHPHLQSEAFEWVLDYCAKVNPDERPSAELLLNVLFGDGTVARRRTHSNVARATARLQAEIKACRGSKSSLNRIKVALSTSGDEVRDLFKIRPETRISGQKSARLERLLRRLTIDRCVTDLHNYPQYVNSATLSHVDFVSVDPDQGLDQAWRDAAVREHRLTFGDGDETLDKFLTGLSETRKTLVGRTSFVRTDAVASLLTVENAKATTADVATLRRWGAILAVTDAGAWLYPSFQFEPGSGVVSPLVLDVYRLLFDDATDVVDIDNWSVLSWWLQPRRDLEGRTYADIIHDPDEATLILDAARLG